MPNLPRTINRLKDPRDLWLFLQIMTMLIRLPGLISKESLPGLMNRIDPGVAPGPRDQTRLDKTAGFIDSLLKYRIFRRYGKCMLRSLVLFHFLRRQGWPVNIRFGVRRMGDESAEVTSDHGDKARADHIGITGHSWLVLDGEPFLESDNIQRYSVTYSYP